MAKPSDDDTEEKVILLKKWIEENAQQRMNEGAYGEVTIRMTWVEGRLKEFRFQEESIIRDANPPSSKN